VIGTLCAEWLILTLMLTVWKYLLEISTKLSFCYVSLKKCRRTEVRHPVQNKVCMRVRATVELVRAGSDRGHLQVGPLINGPGKGLELTIDVWTGTPLKQLEFHKMRGVTYNLRSCFVTSPAPRHKPSTRHPSSKVTLSIIQPTQEQADEPQIRKLPSSVMTLGEYMASWGHRARSRSKRCYDTSVAAAMIHQG
jgi:hypothetical protein